MAERWVCPRACRSKGKSRAWAPRRRGSRQSPSTLTVSSWLNLQADAFRRELLLLLYIYIILKRPYVLIWGRVVASGCVAAVGLGFYRVGWRGNDAEAPVGTSSACFSNLMLAATEPSLRLLQGWREEDHYLGPPHSIPRTHDGGRRLPWRSAGYKAAAWNCSVDVWVLSVDLLHTQKRGVFVFTEVMSS